MENKQDNIPAPDALDEPTLTDEEIRRKQLRASFNNRVSHLCKLVALIIAIVAFATIALRQEMPQFVMMGLCLSVALLAIAMLQDHQRM